ncbi:hypothetical protein Vretifemale_139, partial [Volvox reticuliferus]
WRSCVVIGPGRSAPTMVVSLSTRSCVRFSGRRGIRHGMTVGYTPEQNGAAERLNRMLVEKMRALLLDSKLPQDMWAELAAMVNYLRNISPAEGVPCIPYDLFTGKVPEVGHLRVFGCVMYLHVPKVKRSKLAAVSRRGTLVGYGNGGQYRVLFPDGVVSVHMDVEFDEEVVGVHASRRMLLWVPGEEDSDSDTGTEMVEQQACGQPPLLRPMVVVCRREVVTARQAPRRTATVRAQA